MTSLLLPSPHHRALLLGGDFFLGAVIAATLTKLVRWVGRVWLRLVAAALEVASGGFRVSEAWLVS